MGSRDRKTVAELVYGYFRLGFNQFKNIEERILAGLFAGNHLAEMAGYFKEKHSNIREYAIDKIFPWNSLLSDCIDPGAFASSFLKQPDLFIRIRPGKEIDTIKKLDASRIPYSKFSDGCIGLPNSTKISTILKINEEAVIQDKSSQQTGSLIKNLRISNVWDCCAASGGKSIMVYDLYNDIDLTVSDVRESIISTLKARLKEAGIMNYHSFIIDLSHPNTKLPEREYDLIIADVPCTGSGTWSRTPEQLYFFKEQKISFYTRLQQQIIDTVLTKLRPGGNFIYITCSVFKQENEDIVEYILSNSNIRLVKKELIKGYEQRADTMFAALFRNAPVSE